MVLYFIALLLVVICRLSFAKKGEWFDSLSKQQTSSINGISILLVFVCHIFNALRYHDYAWMGLGDSGFMIWRSYVHQLLVVSFLFYSGYGVMIQVITKGDEYIQSFPVKRVLSLYLNFVIAVCVFAIIHIAFRDGTSWIKILASFTCWRQIGNPSWYVFCILWCYVTTWICYKLCKKFSGNNFAYVCWGGGIFACVYIGILFVLRPRMSWWYNTVLAYSAGMFLAVYREEFVRISRKFWGVLLFLSIAAFLAFYNLPYERCGLRHNLMGCAMMTVIVLLTMKVRIGNRILDWCGSHVFPIYMYHFVFYVIIRLSYKEALSPISAHIIVLSTFVLTLLTAAFFHKFEIRLKWGSK